MPQSLELVVGSIAKRALLGVLATTKEYLSRLFGFVTDWRKGRVPVRTVAKWLLGTSSAGTPKI